MRYRKRHAAWFVVGCAATALLVAVLYTLLHAAGTTDALRGTQLANLQLNRTNHHLLHKVAHLSNEIQSCTTPGRPCANRAARATAAAIDTLSARNTHTAAVAAAAGADCSLHFVGYQAIYGCVVQRLTGAQHRRH